MIFWDALILTLFAVQELDVYHGGEVWAVRQRPGEAGGRGASRVQTQDSPGTRAKLNNFFLSLSISIYIPVSFFSVSLSICPWLPASSSLYMYLSLFLSFILCLSVHLSHCFSLCLVPSMYLSLSLSRSQFLSLFLCLSVHLSHCFSLCLVLSMYLSLYLLISRIRICIANSDPVTKNEDPTGLATEKIS